MVRTSSIWSWTVLLTVALSGCGGLADDDDDSAGDDDVAYKIDVITDGSTTTVDLGDIDTVDYQGSPAVTLPDFLAAAGVDKPEDFTYEFMAWDGYAKDGVTWNKVSMAYIIAESGDLEFPTEAEMESGYFVKGVVAVTLSPVISYELTINWDSNTATVDLFDLPVNDDAIPSVDVNEVLESAGVTSPEGYSYTFTSWDGYAKEGVEWAHAAEAWLVQATGDLQYPEELGLEGNNFVTGVVTIDLITL